MKRLDPEIKALRAVQRALEPLDDEQRRRAILWLAARELNTTQTVVAGVVARAKAWRIA